MSFCKNCGAQLPDNATFCSSCGTPVNTQNQNQANNQQQAANSNPVQPEVLNPVGDDADIQSNKGMAVLSYIGILVLIPLFAAKNSKYAQYHARQGVTLAIFEIAYSIVNFVLTLILGAIFPAKINYFTLTYSHGIVYNVITTILGLASIFFLVLAIIGIVNAAQGNKKELPVIGKIDFIKMFLKK